MSQKKIKRLTSDERKVRDLTAEVERLKAERREVRETIRSINKLERWCDFPTVPEIRPGEGVAGYLRRVLAEVEAADAEVRAELARTEAVAAETFRRGVEASAPVDPAVTMEMPQ